MVPRIPLTLLLLALAAPACMAQGGLTSLIGSWQGACMFRTGVLQGTTGYVCIDGVLTQPYYLEIGLNDQAKLTMSWESEEATIISRKDGYQYTYEAASVTDVALTHKQDAQFGYSQSICVKGSDGNSFIWRLDQFTFEDGSVKLQLFETGFSQDGSFTSKTQCPATYVDGLTCDPYTVANTYQCVLTKLPTSRRMSSRKLFA